MPSLEVELWVGGDNEGRCRANGGSDSRHHGAVVLAGEDVHCTLSLTNTSRDKEATVALASVQLFCHSHANRARIAPATHKPQQQQQQQQQRSSRTSEDAALAASVYSSERVSAANFIAAKPPLLATERTEASDQHVAPPNQSKPSAPPPSSQLGDDASISAKTTQLPSQQQLFNLPQQRQHEPQKTPFSLTGLKGARNACVYASDAIILFCEETFAPGESREYECVLQTSLNGPPSFKGETISYTYKVDAGVQLIGQPVQHIHCPVRILGVDDAIRQQMNRRGSKLLSPSSYVSSIAPLERVDSLGANSFQTREDVLQVAAELARRGKRVQLMLRNSKDLRICNVLMPKTTYRLGETINCVLNLSNAETYLIKASASLCCVETVNEEFRPKNSTEEMATCEHVVASASRFAIEAEVISIDLPLPLTASTAFSTPLVTVKWVAKLDLFFTTEDPLEKAHVPTSHVQWKCPVAVLLANPVSVPAQTHVATMSLDTSQ